MWETRVNNIIRKRRVLRLRRLRKVKDTDNLNNYTKCYRESDFLYIISEKDFILNSGMQTYYHIKKFLRILRFRLH